MIVQAIILSVVVVILNWLSATFPITPWPYLNLFIWALVVIAILGYTVVNPITFRTRNNP